jgi:RNA polymerase sigma factor (sigma-70 family)
MPAVMAGEAPGDVAVEEPSFAATLLAAQRQDPDACAVLWRSLAPAVAAYARAKGSADPDDLTSDVFLAVFRQLSRFQGDEQGFRAYVFTIAHRRLVDELRARSRRGPRVAWSEEGDRRTAVSAEEVALEAAGTSEVRRLLAQLSPDQRAVLELRILGDLTVEQSATVLGKRVGAVKALQRRGLEALRRNHAASRTPRGLHGDGSL